jgi:phage-related minor tail protein
MAEEIGVAFVRLVPSMRGFADAAGDAMNGAAGQPAANAGDAAGQRFGGAFKAGMAGLALAAGAALYAGISEALNQGKVVSMMEASMGTTPELAKRYGEVAGDLFANAVTDDFQTAADAVQQTMEHGLLPTDATMGQIEEMSTGLADVAALMGEEVGPTARAVGQMITTGLAQDGTEALDILTRGVQTGANEAEDLLDTFSEYGTQFRKFGLDGETATGLLSQGLQGGARDADLVADALKEFSIRAIDGSESTAAGFEAIGLSAGDMATRIGMGGQSATDALDETLDKLREIEDPVARDAAAVELFGTQAEDLGLALYELDPSEAAARLGDFAGAASDAGDTLRDNAATKIEQFKRGITQSFVEFLGNEVIPAAIEFKTQAAPAFTAVADAAAGFSERVGPILGDIKSGLSGLSDGFRGVQTDSGTSMTGTQATVQASMTQMGATLASGTESLRTTWDMWGEDITSTTTTYFSKLGQQFAGGGAIIQGVFQVFTGILTGDWRKTWDGIRNIASGAWDSVTAKADDAMEKTKSITRFGMDILQGAWGVAWGSVKAGALWTGRQIVTDTRDWINRMKGQVSGGLGDVVNFFGGLKARVQNKLSGADQWLVSAGKAIIRGLMHGLDAMTGGLLGKLGNIAGTVTSFFPSSPAKRGPLRQHPPQESGAKIVNYLGAGMQSAVPTLAGAASAVAGAAMMPAGAGTYHAGPGSSAAAATPVLRFVGDGSRAAAALMEILQHSIRADYGGDPVAALTPPGR